MGQQSIEVNYLGQKPPGTVAEIFAPGIISTKSYEHSAPAFAPDGSVVLWTVMDTAYRGALLEVRFLNGAWSKPARPSFADSTADDFYPSFAPDGKKLFFSSQRKAPAGFAELNDMRIWQVEKTADGWGSPGPVDTAVSQGIEYAHSITHNGTIYFSGHVGGASNFNIQKAVMLKGRYTIPLLLPYCINSVDYEDGPFIAPDESFLIFESQRAEGTKGNLSLFIAFKQENGSWGMPVNMGPRINSGKGERFARLSPDGKYLFFGSFRNQSADSHGADIYWIDAKVIDELRYSAEAKEIIQQPLADSILAALDIRNVPLAINYLQQWRLVHPDHLDATIIYSSLLRKQKRYSQAEKLFPKALIESGNTGVAMEAALIKFGLDDANVAKKLLTPVLAEKMDLRIKFNYLSDELFTMAKYHWSDEYFDQAIALWADGHAQYSRARAYTLLGEKSKAFDLLYKSIVNGYKSKKDFENDPDLISLKSDECWNFLAEKLK